MRVRFSHQHCQFWWVLVRFMDYYSLFWGPRVISTINKPCDAFTCWSSTQGCAYMSVINTGSFGRFWPVSWTITHCFGVPECFPRLKNPGMRLRVGHQHWQFWPILARFMDYCSLFWGPRVITTINKPLDAPTCRPSTLAVLADSGPFLGLLLTVLGPRSDFHS